MSLPRAQSTSAPTLLSHSEEWTGPVQATPEYQGHEIEPVTTFGQEKKTLERGLRLMARYLSQRDFDLTIITVGGPISTLLISDRSQRRELDFIGVGLNNSDERRRALELAAEYARRSIPPDVLGTSWFAARTMLVLPTEVHHVVVRKAVAADEVVYQARGLKILAAPWEFAFWTTMGKLDTEVSVERRYDYKDALCYLHRYIQGQDDRPVSMAEMEEWARSFGLPSGVMPLSTIAIDYLRMFGQNGVVREEGRLLSAVENNIIVPRRWRQVR